MAARAGKSDGPIPCNQMHGRVLWTGRAGSALTAHRLGFILGKLRVVRGGRINGNQGRQWVLTRADLERWAVSYGMRGEGKEPDLTGLEDL